MNSVNSGKILKKGEDFDKFKNHNLSGDDISVIFVSNKFTRNEKCLKILILMQKDNLKCRDI